MIHLFINLDRWNSLPKAYQALIRTAAETANTWMQAKYDAANPAALKRLLAEGAVLRPFSPDVLDASYAAAQDLYTETADANADFKKVHAHYMAFRSDEYLWWQVAEYSFDTYQIRARSRG